jgi:hypothetical protein
VAGSIVERVTRAEFFGLCRHYSSASQATPARQAIGGIGPGWALGRMLQSDGLGSSAAKVRPAPREKAEMIVFRPLSKLSRASLVAKAFGNALITNSGIGSVKLAAKRRRS